MVKRKLRQNKKVKKKRLFLLKKEPRNYYFWIWVIESGRAHEFEERGNDYQKQGLKRALKYYKNKRKRYE